MTYQLLPFLKNTVSRLVIFFLHIILGVSHRVFFKPASGTYWVINIMNLGEFRGLYTGDIHQVQIELVYHLLQYIMDCIPGAVGFVGLKIFLEQVGI